VAESPRTKIRYQIGDLTFSARIKRIASVPDSSINFDRKMAGIARPPWRMRHIIATDADNGQTGEGGREPELERATPLIVASATGRATSGVR